MNPRKDLSPKLAELQEQLGSARGKKYWRTLEELSDSEAFQELLRQEFPEQASLLPQSVNRRQFLMLMGASLALAGVGGCSVRPAPTRTLVPRVRAPEETVPGRPMFYATTMTMGGAGVGLLVECHQGRPTKVEGNPDHPASLGATDIFHQASILTLYDPDRSQTVTHLGQTRTWDEALAALRGGVEQQRRKRGAGLRVLTETIVSPTLGRQLTELLDIMPAAKWHQYEPAGRHNAYRGALAAFNQPVSTYYDFRTADVVLALDCDFLTSGPGNLHYVADFMARRRVRTAPANGGQTQMNRLYAVEPMVTGTGTKADHRLALRAGDVEALARAVAAKLGIEEARGQSSVAAANQRWVDAIGKDLEGHRGRCLVIIGDRQPAAVHLLAHAMNVRLGNLGQTVFHSAPVETRPVDQIASLAELAEDMAHDRVEILLILGGNPVYNAPADFHFAQLLQRLSLRSHLSLHLSLYQDETSRLCQWHIPEAHYLEAWSDTRAYDGTASIVQPVIEPLYHGKSAHEILTVVTHELQAPPYETVRATWRKHWQQQGQGSPFEPFWQTAVHDGTIPGTKSPPKSDMQLRAGWQAGLLPAGQPSGGYELVFQTDPTIHDGCFANNGWLQELPKPITTLTWDNAAIMSPATARELGVDLGGYAHGGEHGGFHPDVVELQLGDTPVPAPIWIMPGHVDGSITVSLGYGRAAAGRVGGSGDQKVGFDAYPLRTSERLWFARGLTVRKTGQRALVACTQQHQLMENRDLVRAATLEQYRHDPHFASQPERDRLHDQTQGGIRQPLTMYQPFEYPKHRWGMAIDLTACTGCKACVVACQAENNIPVVGKEQVAAGREMHWLRVDRYIEGPLDNPREFHFQPVPCMHCENAPCEYVCPVEATVHSAEGLNDMVYQRCVGTRFCSNNCPYKVRRFNFFHYSDYKTETLRLQYNPEVTVRSRGVMEKCSYCVQRIRRAEIDSQVEGRAIADGEILTACQAVCPAKAIVFGNINDAASDVKKCKDTPLNYALLEEVNTHPRTTYLAAVRNPNPELEL
jgi:molybdopterin-containing oxidoreductase family iron-sulfur binding subunit